MTGFRKWERFFEMPNIVPRFLGHRDRCCLTPFRKYDREIKQKAAGRKLVDNAEGEREIDGLEI